VNWLRWSAHILKKQSGEVGRGTVGVMLVMAALVLLILYSLGWQFIITTDGAKMLAYMKQIETANMEFRTKVGAWPNAAVVDQNPVDNILALIDPNVLTEKLRKKSENLMAEAEIVDGVLRHPFGTGGTVMQTVVKDQGNDYLLIVMTDIPVNTFEDADRREDGVVDWTSGRLQTDEDPATSQTVTVTYLANRLDTPVSR